MSTDTEVFFLWTDLETTGLDEKKDRILEIAWAITDHEFNPVFEPEEHIIAQDDWLEFFHYWREDVSDVVKKMHTDNGLFQDIQDDAASNLDHAYMILRKNLEELPRKAEVHLAGRSVHFDRGFLLNNDFGSLWDPKVQGGPLISHRVFDVRTLRTFFDLNGLTVPVKDRTEGRQHRALDDVYGDIDFARSATALLKSAFPYPPVLISAETVTADLVDADPTSLLG